MERLGYLRIQIYMYIYFHKDINEFTKWVNSLVDRAECLCYA